ncbi:MAG: alpha-hydroxy-acid oxidizing protein [Deltaproteobacteria bacterium]|nr:alpha-hydroxy-acid oxidizing protein [Deltaproteobacteria bacterium]
MDKIRERARLQAKGACRVCRQCDGRICSGEVPGMGGAGTGLSFRHNFDALATLRFKTKLVHQVHFPKTEKEIFGFKLSFPVMIAPIGGLAFNLNRAMDEAEYQEAVVMGAQDAGIVSGTPDAAPMEVMQLGLAQAAKTSGRALPFIKPWEPGEIAEKLSMAKEAGCKTAAVDLDSIGLITLRLMGRPAYPKSVIELAAIVDSAHQRGMKLIIKGVMTAEDALDCLTAGVDGLVVSNHGGRVLDSAPGTAEVLPLVARAVEGAVPVLVDGGVRSGGDVLKMLALGADCVMIGRPFAIAAVGGGREGVAHYAETLRSQLEQVMIMTGCPDVAEAGPHLLT